MMTVVVITTLKMNNMIVMMTEVIISNPKSDHHDHDESIIGDYCGEDGDDDVDDFNLSYYPDDDWGEGYCPKSDWYDNDVVMIISPKEITMPMMMTVVMTMILVV